MAITSKNDIWKDVDFSTVIKCCSHRMINQPQFQFKAIFSMWI